MLCKHCGQTYNHEKGILTVTEAPGQGWLEADEHPISIIEKEQPYKSVPMLAWDGKNVHPAVVVFGPNNRISWRSTETGNQIKVIKFKRAVTNET